MTLGTWTAEGTRFVVSWIAETGSTNTDLMEAARQGAPEGTVFVADHQLAGRGRLDRRWEAPVGASLLVSVLLRPTVVVGDAHLVTMAVGLAAADACADVAGVSPALKWPNDLVVDDAKLGGILAESLLSGSSLAAVVVGMGLNVNWPTELPEELAFSATALNHLAGHAVDRRRLLERFLGHLERWYERLHQPDLLLADYRTRSATLGRRVRVQLAEETFEGIAVDVTSEGHLLVDADDGARRTVTAGDAIHLRPS